MFIYGKYTDLNNSCQVFRQLFSKKIKPAFFLRWNPYIIFLYERIVEFVYNIKVWRFFL